VCVESGDDQEPAARDETGVNVGVLGFGKFQVQMHHPRWVEFGGVILVFPVNRPTGLEVVEKLVADVFWGWAVRPDAVAQGGPGEIHIPDLESGRGLGTNLGGCGWRQVHCSEPA